MNKALERPSNYSTLIQPISKFLIINLFNFVFLFTCKYNSIINSL